MPRVIFIYPCVGRSAGDTYVRSWQMQPLGIAALAGLTPQSWERAFYDDRFEPIDYEQGADLVAISVETYTARRAYQIAARFRARGIPVVMGGYHPTLCPEDAAMHADAICIGEAEGVWQTILDDALAGSLQPRYHASPGPLDGPAPDRSIFDGKTYFKLAMVETGRGCPVGCSFCSIAAFFGPTYRRRSTDAIVEEIRALSERTVFFVDDNIVADTRSARELFEALTPLNIRWISQASINVARDPELLDLMQRSGCMGLLIGFESLDDDLLRATGKTVNRSEDYSTALKELRARGIVIYSTFMFGLEGDCPELMDRETEFCIRERTFLAAFNHVVPFPGTPLYRSLAEAGRLSSDAWWLEKDYRFGMLAFEPKGMTRRELEDRCHAARRRFYGLASIFRRSLDWRANTRSLARGLTFWTINLLMRRELTSKFGRPLGVEADA
jgi:radical SAM superfamily enzyme YgiQ (UPF0313 family)